MTVQITDLEKITLTVAEQNAAGGVVSFGGVPVWTSSDETVASVLASPDGVSCVVTSGHAGLSTVTVSVDGLSAIMFVSVVPSPGVQLVITASAPEPK